MTSQSSDIHIDALGTGDVSAAARVMAEAFRSEAFVAHVFDLSTLAQLERFARAVELRLLVHRQLGQPLLVARENDRIVGLAVVHAPAAEIAAPIRHVLAIALPRFPRLLRLLGQIGLRQTLQIRRAVRPPAALPPDHYTLEALAVAPERQGQGIGRQLLDEVHVLCDRNERASGVYLYTGDERNRDLYRRAGYRIVEAKPGGPLTAYHMFRARQTPALHVR